ncbi:hypothetical protein [Microvirgula aerodenitrificans]|uniref:hypothetical protein n=1 Tax=Microvirgula aerodenitrificans TaxID=57480 RepID=UPI002F415EF2
MTTIFYRVGRRTELHAFTPLIDDSASDLAEQAAADYWQRTGIASSRRPLHISLFDERGQLYGTFSVTVEQAPIYRATPATAMQRAVA